MSGEQDLRETAGVDQPGGAVLRGVALHGEARPLRRPSLPRPQGDAPAAGEPVLSGQDALAAAYEQGFRAGMREGEAAQQATYQSAIEGGREAGFARGLQEGREQGVAEGQEAVRQAMEREMREAQEETSARLTQLDRLLALLPGELARRLEGAEEDMVALCHAVVCKMVGEHLVTRDGIAHAVRQAVSEAGGHSTLRGTGHGGIAVHLHPRDLQHLEGDAQVAAWLRPHTGAKGVQWVADERVRLGGCIVRTGEGSLDARLESQMAALRQLLVQGMSENEATSALPPPATGAAEALSHPERRP